MKGPDIMFGVRTKSGEWLCPLQGPGRFFDLVQRPVYPFRTRDGAEELAMFFLAGMFLSPEVVQEPAKRC